MKLINKLNLYGVRGTVNNWFRSYLGNRFQFVQIDCIKSKILPISCGVPQGSILGALLFILNINDIVNISKLAEVIMFADDTNLFFSHENLDDLISLVNCELIKFVLLIIKDSLFNLNQSENSLSSQFTREIRSSKFSWLTNEFVSSANMITSASLLILTISLM